MKKVSFLILFFILTGTLAAQYTWVAKSQFPDNGKLGASCFIINGMGYIVGGGISLSPITYSTETWQYNPNTDSWTSKAPFPNPIQGGYGLFNKRERICGWRCKYIRSLLQ